MTDLCLTLATLTGSELSNILWLTFGIFALWRILLTHLEMLTWMTVGSDCQGPGFENLKTESPVAQHHPEEAVNKIS